MAAAPQKAPQNAPQRAPQRAHNALHALQDLGQSVWLDSVRRSYLRDGGYLPRLVEAREVDGLTSNPTIFEKAIDEDDSYDEALADLRERGVTDGREALWSLMKADVAATCDLFRPLYDASGGTGGLVSIELDPSDAFDTEASVSSGLMLFRELDRPNLMVKVPGTEPGLPAITRLIAEGVNVNVTLLFSVPRYEAVVEAFQDGLRRRHDAGEDVSRVASVASFFVSRVDTKVQAVLGDDRPLVDTAGIANARVAYESFRRLHSTDDWRRLTDAGARPQRPLWASTSAKDDALADTVYVDGLAGPDTVNTMPEATLDAVRDHGSVEDRLTGTGGEARRQLQRLAEQGVDLDQITKELETEGVEKFVDSFDAAADALAERLR